MRKHYIILIILSIASACKTTRVQTTSKPHVSLDRQEYINKYQDLSIREMKRSGVPASITMAQAILESDNGNSTLARKGNNHFGIKCHSTWKGQKIYHDDDRKGECFRKYPSVYDSYIDHSDFLVNTRRYSSLFDLNTTDYKGWARGLQKAGYATSKTYAQNLIRIIEENNLSVLDKGGSFAIAQNPTTSNNQNLVDVDNYVIDINEHTIYNRNRIDYIIVKEGDTFRKLTDEMQLLPWELPKYNELGQNDKLNKGQILYLQPKRNKAEVGNDYHIVNEGESMYQISQQYGIKLEKLYDKNLMRFGSEPKSGEKLWLRKVKPLEEVKENQINFEEIDE